MKKYFFIYISLLMVCRALFAEELPPSHPLSIYLSWEENPTTTTVVKWISSKSDTKSCVRYKETNNSSWRQEEGVCIPFPNDEPFFLHKVYLKNLLPKTLYAFRIDGYDVCHSFETAPENLTEPLSFIIGGDINLSNIDLFEETTEKAAQLNPLFIIMGGDLACPNIKHSVEDPTKWLTLLKIWYETAQNKDRLIPFLPLIGNHDVQGSYDMPIEKAPYFSLLFCNEKKETFFSLRFGSYASIYFLDSGHISSPAGEQSKWLAKELFLDEHTLHRIAIYHVSAYPPVRSYRNPYCSSVRRAFSPLFDEFHLHLAFENHDHAYKRTHPLTDSMPNPRGVVYIGNGSWGAKPRVPKRAEQTLYLAKTVQMRGFCFVRLSEKSRDVFATRFDGILIDSLYQSTDPIAAQELLQKNFTLWKKTKNYH